MGRIRTENLNLYYGSRKVLKNINIFINENAVTAFIGPSGCEKPSFLKTLNRMNDFVGLVKIYGNIYFESKNIYKEFDEIELRKRIGMVFQSLNPFPMSIYDNIAYDPKIHGIKSKSRLDEIN